LNQKKILSKVSAKVSAIFLSLFCKVKKIDKNALKWVNLGQNQWILGVFCGKIFVWIK